MIFLKKKQQVQDATRDRLAMNIAGQIIAWQRLLAAKLNNGINRFSKARQKRLLWIFCGVSSCSLIISILVPLSKVKSMQGHNFHPTHIGLPAVLPRKTTSVKTTDSLTTKK
jgi:hypothetical protein